jgi:hypothetical protein
MRNCGNNCNDMERWTAPRTYHDTPAGLDGDNCEEVIEIMTRMEEQQ